MVDATPSAGPERSATADLLGLSEDFDLDAVKDAAVPAVTGNSRKRPRLTQDQLFEDEMGLKKVIKDFPKLKFRGKGHEFEDLKVLCSAYETWLKEVYPPGAGDHFEDNVWRVRQTLEDREKDSDGGLVSDPRERLHRFRYEYKSAGGEGTLAAQKKAAEAAAAKAALRAGKELPDDMRKRIEANRLRALELKKQREGGSGGAAAAGGGATAASSSGAPSLEEEKRLRIEANRQKALDLKKQREEQALAEALAADEALFLEAQGAPSTSGPSAPPQAARPTGGFDDEEDVFGLGFGMDSESFERGPIPTPMQKQLPQQTPTFAFDEEDPFGNGFGMDEDDFHAPSAKPPASAPPLPKAPQAPPQPASLFDEEDVFGYGGFGMDDE